jgi:hypothetical protein
MAFYASQKKTGPEKNLLYVDPVHFLELFDHDNDKNLLKFRVKIKFSVKDHVNIQKYEKIDVKIFETLGNSKEDSDKILGTKNSTSSQILNNVNVEFDPYSSNSHPRNNQTISNKKLEKKVYSGLEMVQNSKKI